jgi:hypothetical protein
LVIGFIKHYTRNYKCLRHLHTPKITLTTAHIKSSQSSLAVVWWRLPTADVPLTLGSRIVPGLSYQILTSHNCNSLSYLSGKLLLALDSTVILGSESRGLTSLGVVQFYSDLSVSLNSKLKSKLLYDERFTANQFVLAPSPLRLTTRDFFATEPLWS